MCKWLNYECLFLLWSLLTEIWLHLETWFWSSLSTYSTRKCHFTNTLRSSYHTRSNSIAFLTLSHRTIYSTSFIVTYWNWRPPSAAHTEICCHFSAHLYQFKRNMILIIREQPIPGLWMGWDNPIPSHPMGHFSEKFCPMGWDGTEIFFDGIPWDGKFVLWDPIGKIFSEKSIL